MYGTAVVARTQTDPDGEFTVRLPAGHYDVKAQRPTGLIRSASTTVTVTAGTSPPTATVYLDTGIR